MVAFWGDKSDAKNVVSYFFSQAVLLEGTD